MNNLPEGLEETYNHILLKISPKHHADVKRFLQWLAFSTQSLTLAELAETVTVDIKSGNEPKYTSRNQYKNPQDVLVRCSSLIIESQGMISILKYGILLINRTGTVRLSHFSVKEYLCSD